MRRRVVCPPFSGAKPVRAGLLFRHHGHSNTPPDPPAVRMESTPRVEPVPAAAKVDAQSTHATGAPPPAPAPAEPPTPQTAAAKPWLLGAKYPKGFEAVYAFPFRRPEDAVSRSEAAVPAFMEAMVLKEMARTFERKQRWRRYVIRGVVLTCVTLYLAGYQRLVTAYRMITGTTLTGDAAPAVGSIWVAMERHVAAFYDREGSFLWSKPFIDYFAFENEVKSDPATAAAPLLIGIPAYYPWLPMGLLLLIPFLAFFHDSFAMANRTAMRAAATATKGDKRFKFQTDKLVKTKLDDVAGLTEAKHEIVEIIDFLRNPLRYTGLGARLPKGVLLDGPPGVGKTLIAKAVAGEAAVPFVSCSGSEFDEVFVGVGAARVRELFKEARKTAPCVVFIDEIDAFGKKRQSDGRGGSRGTLNALLSELDGFKDATGIIVLAATNRADILDNALTRSGRFDRKITLEKPPHKDRVQIARVHLKPLLLDPSLDIDSAAEQLASLTPGCSGADIYNICNEAAIIASREGRENVSMACFHKSLERILVGMTKKAKRFTDDERKRLAYHEAGHAVLQWFLPLTEPVAKVSIVPRGSENVGVTQKLPIDKYIVTQEELHQRMIAKLGGYVTEELFFHDLSTSAAEDLRSATEMAWNEIARYGMAPVKVGHFHFETDDGAIQKPFGPKKEDEIDESVSALVSQTLGRARELLRTHIDRVRIIGGLLLRNETISAHELWRVLGERPLMTAEFRRFLEARQ